MNLVVSQKDFLDIDYQRKIEDADAPFRSNYICGFVSVSTVSNLKTGWSQKYAMNEMGRNVSIVQLEQSAC